ncbi:MAG: carboxypeptidase-like regulatory domain-containing protein, partial [Mameliella sp.]|nr:carboxypeptidase-like regulatory domain-containing protein [Phaeodactylibacter sp.]
MKPILTILLFALPLSLIFAQSGGVSGKVASPDGAPLPYASIFVKETGTGTTTNEEGQFEIRLPAGNYQLVFQFLGYKTVAKPVAVGSRLELLNVTLQEQPLQLQAVDVLEGA